MVAGIWLRAGDSTWLSALNPVRWKYDLLGGSLATFALLIAAGLFRRAEWARLFGISLCCIVAFTYLGLPVVAAWYADVSRVTVLHVEGLVVGALATIDAVLLNGKAFRDAYSADPRSQRPAPRAAAEPPGR
jgi:hypothetical protein